MGATFKEIKAALQTGNLKQLKDWVDNKDLFKRTRYNLTNGNNKALCLAAERNQLEVVKWLMDECGSTVVPTHPGLQAEITTWLRGFGNHVEPGEIPEHMNACRVAIRAYHFNIAEWMLRHPSVNRELTTAGFGDVIYDLVVSVAMPEDFVGISDSAGVDLLKWVFTRIARDREQVQRLFDSLLVFSSVDWVMWLFQNSKVEISVTAGSFSRFGSRQADGEFEIVQWLIEKSGQIIDCRDWRKYRTQTWNPGLDEYLDTVKLSQDLCGLEEGTRAVKIKAGLRDAAKRRI